MTKLIKIIKSSNNKKKYDAFFEINGKNKKISFGAEGYRDYTLINNKNSKFYLSNKKDRDKVRDQYQRRHKKDLLTDKNKLGLGAGALSYYLLWTTPKMNISLYKKRFNL